MALAGKQHGVVTRAQLVARHMHPSTIDNRLATGRLHGLHRGVYLVAGPSEPPLARAMAAVLTCGPGVVLSHFSAAALLQLLPHLPWELPIHVSVAGRNPGRRQGVHVHRLASLPASDVTTHDRLPVTTPARTLLDLAPALDPRHLERATAEAFALRLVSRPSLLAVAERNPRHRGRGRLLELVEAKRAPARTRSAPEERLLCLIRHAGLPEPETNVRIGRWEVDFLWRERRLVVEVDAYSTHSSPWAFERDRLKQSELQAAGLRVERISARRVDEAPEAALAQVSGAL